MLPNQNENQNKFIFKYYSFKIAFLKVLHFLADIYKYTSFPDDILNKRDNLFTQKSCQVIPLTHFAKSQRCQADLMPL